MLVSGTIGNSSVLKQDVQNTIASSKQIVSVVSVSTTNTDTSTSQSDSSSKNQKKNINSGVEKTVREYFADIPLMVEISECESHYRQLNADGSVFRGKINTNDVGALQINETYHLKRSIKLGYDVHTLEGNMAYARLLYKEQGPQPWSSSYPCWNKSPLAANFKPRSRAFINVPIAIRTTSLTSVNATTSVSDDTLTGVSTSMTGEPLATDLISIISETTSVASVTPVLTTNISILAER